MLVRYNTFIIFALHPTCNKRVMGIRDKVSIIILIFIAFIRERKEGSVLSCPLFVCVGHPLGSDERLYDRERRRSRFFFVTAIRFPRFRRGCVVLRACFLDLFFSCVFCCASFSLAACVCFLVLRRVTTWTTCWISSTVAFFRWRKSGAHHLCRVLRPLHRHA